jgi:Fe-S oxidoreductase
MNVCANFQAVGGHAFGGECYTGGIGGAWTVGTTGNLAKGKFAELCTGCSRCIPNCPVRIDIPRLNTVIKHRLLEAGGPSLQKLFFGNFSRMARFASLVPSLANWIGDLRLTKRILNHTVGVDERRSIPPFASSTLRGQFFQHKKAAAAVVKIRPRKLMLFADIYTQYNNPQVGMAAMQAYEKLGFRVELGDVLEDGRAALSQGLIPPARKSAAKVVRYLEPLVSVGYDILFTEPSVLSMIRQDYRALVKDARLVAKIQEHCFDPIEYLNRLIGEGVVNRKEIRRRIRNEGTKLFCHGHCQMNSIGIGSAAPAFFGNLGFKVEVSTAECCGMAGSFGYKKQYYALSRNIGDDLSKQIDSAFMTEHGGVVLASGTSCREQISAGWGGTVFHPIEFLNSVLG